MTLTEIEKELSQALNAAGLLVSEKIVVRLLASLLSKRFLILTGLSGSGKTKVAQSIAQWLTKPGTHHSSTSRFCIGEIVTSSRVTYEVVANDIVSVTFRQPETGTLVTLPYELIGDWVSSIRLHGFTENTRSREIREAVESTTKYSPQQNSFETHLKAAAFHSMAKKSEQATDNFNSYVVVPVGADWTSIESILGYPNGLDKSAYIAKPTLELILRAGSNPNVPHFLILDEMNLSHVERYFSDILSAIESDEKIHLHQDTNRQSGGFEVPAEIALPKNLFIIGTVNVDETTYMFSPKVLDRASAVEFRMESAELEQFLVSPGKPRLDLLDGKGDGFGRAFVEASQNSAALPDVVKDAFNREILLFFRVMQAHGAEFGYRVAHEAARFVHFYKLLGAHSDDSDWFPGAFDCIVVQKILPKLHGSRAKLGPLLKLLWFLCVNSPVARGEDPLHAALEASRSTDKNAEPTTEIPPGAPYPLSAEKVARMWRLLRDNGFTSFAEA